MSLLHRLLRRDEPTLCEQYRKLWPTQRTARVLYAKSDGRERLTLAFRVLTSVQRKMRRAS